MDMHDARPVIVIFAHHTTQAHWAEVLFGMEEEGIPWEWVACDSENLVDNAWQAACQSPLLVGIGCDDETLLVHYRNLPVDGPLFRLPRHDRDADARRTGNNAARLVKGLPFK